MTTISQIEKQADSIEITQLDELTEVVLAELKPELFEQLKRLREGVCNIYIPLSYLTESVSQDIKKALEVYLFKKQHWKTRQDGLKKYLARVLHNLTTGFIYKIVIGENIPHKPCCPACSYFDQISFIKRDDGVYKCTNCINISLRKEELSAAEIELRSIFESYSSTGVRCPSCKRWVPDSYISGKCLKCPYFDCTFFDLVSKYTKGTHPVSIFLREITTDSEIIKSDESNLLTTEDKTIISDELEEIYEQLTLIIKKLMKQEDGARLPFNDIMYQAFLESLNQFPLETINYLAYNKSGEISIQSQIFQKYIEKIENYLPFEIKKKNKIYSITDLLDPNLNLFLGESVFESSINEHHTIHNKTKECYVGSRKLKNHGPCYIGRLIDITDAKGKSILPLVKDYSFSLIHVDHSLQINQPVLVHHYRIPSHYQIHHMVYLQNAKNIIMSKLQKAINGN